MACGCRSAQLSVRRSRRIVTECVTANSYYAPNTGRGIRAGIWAGAKMDSSCAPMVFDRGVVVPGVKAGYVEDANGNLAFPGTMSQLIIGTQPYLKVNKEGKRFANESVPYDFMNYAASLQTDGVYAAILPGNVTDDILAYDQYGCAQDRRQHRSGQRHHPDARRHD